MLELGISVASSGAGVDGVPFLCSGCGPVVIVVVIDVILLPRPFEAMLDEDIVHGMARLQRVVRATERQRPDRQQKCRTDVRNPFRQDVEGQRTFGVRVCVERGVGRNEREVGGRVSAIDVMEGYTNIRRLK